MAWAAFTSSSTEYTLHQQVCNDKKFIVLFLLKQNFYFSNAEQVDLADIKIVDNSTIIRGKILGKGAFGEVFEGILQKTDTKVAIKVSK